MTFEDRPYTEEDMDSMYKGLILAMQGSWTAQPIHSWHVCNASYEEDAPAAVHMWRPHNDGTRRLMMRNELLTNKTMYPIGRIALDLEHLRMFEMLQILRQLPTEVTIHGCINDCFKVTGIDEKDAEDCCRKLLYADKTPVFKVKTGATTAPLCEWKYACVHYRFSRWRANNEEFENGPMNKEAYWVANRGARQGLCLVEEEGLGRFADGNDNGDCQEGCRRYRGT